MDSGQVAPAPKTCGPNMVRLWSIKMSGETAIFQDTFNKVCQELLEERRSPLTDVNVSSNNTSLEIVLLCDLQPFEV